MPAKADSILVVDANAVLATPVSVQCFQPVPWRGSQIFKDLSVVDHFELSHCDSPEIRWKSLAGAIAPELFHLSCFEGRDDDE
jgi:hypothetical protein